MTTESQAPVRDVVVVGAGFAGLYAIHAARKAGLDVLCLEAAAGVGGTWYFNRYPGARCDVESIDYSYSFDEGLQREWRWSERYATQPEILAYAEHVADRFELRRSIRLNTRVSSAEFDEVNSIWSLRTDVGAVHRARYVLFATGLCRRQSSRTSPEWTSSPGKCSTPRSGHTRHRGSRANEWA